MRVFRKQEDVVLVEVCGEQLLVATGQARDLCPFVTQLNASAAAFWRVLEGEMSLQSLVDAAAHAQGTEPKSLLLPGMVFVAKAGYLVAEDRP